MNRTSARQQLRPGKEPRGPASPTPKPKPKGGGTAQKLRLGLAPGTKLKGKP